MFDGRARGGREGVAGCDRLDASGRDPTVATSVVSGSVVTPESVTTAGTGSGRAGFGSAGEQAVDERLRLACRRADLGGPAPPGAARTETPPPTPSSPSVRRARRARGASPVRRRVARRSKKAPESRGKGAARHWTGFSGSSPPGGAVHSNRPRLGRDVRVPQPSGCEFPRSGRHSSRDTVDAEGTSGGVDAPRRPCRRPRGRPAPTPAGLEQFGGQTVGMSPWPERLPRPGVDSRVDPAREDAVGVRAHRVRPTRQSAGPSAGGGAPFSGGSEQRPSPVISASPPRSPAPGPGPWPRTSPDAHRGPARPSPARGESVSRRRVSDSRRPADEIVSVPPTAGPAAWTRCLDPRREPGRRAVAPPSRPGRDGHPHRSASRAVAGPFPALRRGSHSSSRARPRRPGRLSPRASPPEAGLQSSSVTTTGRRCRGPLSSPGCRTGGRASLGRGGRPPSGLKGTGGPYPGPRVDPVRPVLGGEGRGVWPVASRGPVASRAGRPCGER